MYLCVKNWHEHQHYQGRTPPWIKLHKRLLDDYEFHLLPVASRALAPLIWLLASEHSEGKIPLDEKKIAFRLHLTVAELKAALNPLIEGGFMAVEHDASTALADCKHDARSETETEKEEEKDISINFESFWKAVPRRVGKGAALRAYRVASKKAEPETILTAMKAFAQSVAGKDPQYIPHPATWLNAERWLDEPAKPNGNGGQSIDAEESQMKARAKAIAGGMKLASVSDHQARTMVQRGYLTDEQARKAGYAA